MGRLSIGFQGEHGAYSEEAIYKRFGRGVATVPSPTIRGVFALTESGEVDLGMVPVENSVEGSINETYDMFVVSGLSVVGEVVLRVVHCLVALPGAELGGIRVVYSHPQALAQCRGFISSLGAEPVVTYDTAGSAKMIKENGLRDAAAIAGERSARLYGLKVLRKGIEDYSTNSTRFLVVSRVPAPYAGPRVKKATKPASGGGARGRRGGGGGGWKTSLIFSVSHTPGSLYNALEVFARARINLTKIESRPTKERPWEYYFFVDFEGRREERRVSGVLEKLASRTASIKVLGSYPRSREADR